VRAVVLVPHFLVLAMLGTLAGLLQFVVWYPVLPQNRYPRWGSTRSAERTATDWPSLLEARCRADRRGFDTLWM